ncbi:3'-5' exonuclease [Pseudoalteromonas sp.]|uniref:3'-5' exonuclease n=1 Tax=Pseudoalteromonas sp. TaxID=53249 RepID=UPI003561F505
MLKHWLSEYLTKRRLYTQAALKQRYLVIDLELTGLNAQQHEIVSVAWVIIEDQCIKMSQSQHLINNQVKNLAQSPIFHGIDNDNISQGQSLSSILVSLSEHFSDTILVCHNAMLDWGFLKLALIKANLTRTPSLILDTLQIEKKRLQQQGAVIKSDDLTLSECRRRYQLPEYRAHHALTDAQATAELFLAQCQQISGGKELAIKALL